MPEAGDEISASALTRSGSTAATRWPTAPPKELPTSAADSMPAESIVASTSSHGAYSSVRRRSLAEAGKVGGDHPQAG